jgi:hypothetical protein
LTSAGSPWSVLSIEAAASVLPRSEPAQTPRGGLIDANII